MFAKMLVATDLSEASTHWIAALGALKSLGTREALLVHCVNIRDAGGLADMLMNLAAPVLTAQQKTLEGLGFAVEAKMVLGLPHIEVPRLAAEQRCSFVVVGSQGHTLAGDLLLGGVASAVVHATTTPVLVLRVAKTSDGAWSTPLCCPLEHVLFPTDFSDNAERAFAYVKQLVACGAKRITLLHVQDKGYIGRHLQDRLAEFNAIDTQRLARLKDELTRQAPTSVTFELPYGNPKHEILARIKQGDIGLVVMGSHGRGYAGDLLLGSVSHAVVRQSAAPVLLIPAP